MEKSNCLWCKTENKFPFCDDGGTVRVVNHLDTRKKTTKSYCLNDYMAYRKVRATLELPFDEPMDEFFRLYHDDIMAWYKNLEEPQEVVHTYARPEKKMLPIDEVESAIDAVDEKTAIDYMEVD